MLCAGFVFFLCGLWFAVVEVDMVAVVVRIEI